MKKCLYVILLLTVFMVGNIEVNASSGKLRNASIKTCNGITYGQHSSDNHWHVAQKRDSGYYPVGSAIYSNPCSSNSTNNSQSEVNSSTSNSNNTTPNNSANNQATTSKQEESKSSDNTLKTIIINDKKFEATDNINYSTKEEKVDIKVIPNDEKATYKIDNNSTLSIGENKIIVKVTAEDGTTKNYNINVNREQILSSDTGIKVIIDDEEVIFENYKATFYISSTTTNINLNYTLNDSNSKVELDKIDKLITGDNYLNIKVTAQDNTEQIYQITIHKYSKWEETTSTLLGIGTVGGISYGIYYIIKKKKSA